MTWSALQCVSYCKNNLMTIGLSRTKLLPKRVRALQILLLLLVSVVAFIALTQPIGLRPNAPPLAIGDVAPYNLFAPTDSEYVSEVRTEEARQAAESAVSSIYTSPDSTIGRQQIESLQTALQNITSVRDDALLAVDQKKEMLAQLSDARLDPKSIDYVLAISSARWETIQAETLRVLEQVVRRSIHEDDLESAQKNIPSLISLTLNEPQTNLVTALVAAFVVPNSFYSEELTQAARQRARDAIQPVVKTYKEDEMVVPEGEIITPSDLEALQQLGMIQPGQQWQDTLGAAILSILSSAFIYTYFFRRKRMRVLRDVRSLFVITFVFIFFLLAARLAIPNRTVIPYLFPLPAAGLLLATLFGTEVALVISISLCVLITYGLPNALDLFPYYLFSSIFGLLALGPARRFWSFVTAGAAIALSGMGLLFAYRISFADIDLLGVTQLLGAAAGNGFLSAGMALLGQYFLAQTLGIATALQLLEISRPDSPLLKFFLNSAPGTYQHSLQVANLAEQAAEKIGADPLLTRVGALFHDVGKANNPNFFIENQDPTNLDKHDDMDAENTAQLIIRHVTDGVQMARKYRLPSRLEDFMLEHHGTLITRYQYNQAMEAAKGDVKKVDIEKFRYPGPRPASRETALLMLADATEARARAERPPTDDDLRALVRNVIDIVQKNGQLDDTLLTLRDLHLITESFVTTMRGTYHPRIQYPNIKLPDQDTTLVRRKDS